MLLLLSSSPFFLLSLYLLLLLLCLPFLQPHDFNCPLLPPSLPVSLPPPFSPCSSHPPSLSNCPPLSGNLAEAKCFLLSRCRWDCNKACQWEAWVALSHALCLPSVNSLQPTNHHPPLPIPSNPSTRRSLPKMLCFYPPPPRLPTHTHTTASFVCLFFPHFALLSPETRAP